MKFCPLCRTELHLRFAGDMDRLACPDETCNFVHWDNPVPVVAAVVEHDDQIILANNVAWPEDIYAVITGFLEKNESSEDGIVREVKEELGLESEQVELINVYPFYRMNQIIIGYYILASGRVSLNEELRSFKHIEKKDVKTWDSATGYILRDWLRTQGFEPQEISLFKKDREQIQRSDLYQRIDTMVNCIPRGKVASYGQIAKLVGSCGARQVGYAMSALSENSEVPWHRVVNSQGKISSRGSEGHELQRILLESEGIVFSSSGKINLETFRWRGPDTG